MGSIWQNDSPLSAGGLPALLTQSPAGKAVMLGVGALVLFMVLRRR